MHGEDDRLPVFDEFLLCIPMESRDDLFMANNEILLSSKPSGVPNGAPSASVEDHVGLSLMGVCILTTPVATCSGFSTVLTILLTLEEKCLPP
jgi:hypothetical protein